jgi:hypothetical protein
MTAITRENPVYIGNDHDEHVRVWLRKLGCPQF